MTTGRTFEYQVQTGDKWGYTITVTPADPVTGRYPQITRKGFKSERAARSAMNEAIGTIAKEGAPATNTGISVKDWAHKWLQSNDGKLRPWTCKTYHHTVLHYIIPHLGSLPLAKLSPRHIQRMYDTLGETLSQVTVHRVHRTLRTCLLAAVKEGVLDKSPTSRVESPERRSVERKTLSVADAKRMLAWMKEHRPTTYRAAFLAIYTGMRQGEVAGLQWQDIDFDDGLIRIQRTRQRIAKTDTLGAAKTYGSHRRIIVFPMVIEELKRWRDEQKESPLGCAPDRFVVQTDAGKTPAPAAWTTVIRMARKELDLPPVTFHDLRHTHATWLLESGVDLKTVSERLGHASITITADLYGHVTDDMQRKAMEKLGAMMKEKER